MEAIEAITKAVPETDLRICRRIEIGKAIHQGDVYVHRVADDHPSGAALGSRQVAVGSQVGARHIADGPLVVLAGVRLPPTVTEPDWVEKGALLGPVVHASGPWTLTHPEHAHHRLPAGTYQVTYQADATTRRRVVD